jgi:hypothetical protein
MDDVLPRVPYWCFWVLLNHAHLAKHGEKSIQYACVALAVFLFPLTIPQESIHHVAIQIADVKMFLLKPSAEIGDHHDLRSNRMPRVALLGHGSSVRVKVLAQRSMT